MRVNRVMDTLSTRVSCRCSSTARWLSWRRSGFDKGNHGIIINGMLRANSSSTRIENSHKFTQKTSKNQSQIVGWLGNPVLFLNWTLPRHIHPHLFLLQALFVTCLSTQVSLDAAFSHRTDAAYIKDGTRDTPCCDFLGVLRMGFLHT